MKGFIFLFLFISTTGYAITESQCPNYDQRKNFPQIKDQDTHGICWAFAGSGLIEEKLCQENPKMCGVKVSVIDGHRCYWSETTGMGTGVEGAPGTSTYLDCVLEQGGVCLEQDAPFTESGWIPFFSKDQKDYSDMVKKAFDRVQKIKNINLHRDTVICPGRECTNSSLRKDFFYEIMKVSNKLQRKLEKRENAPKVDYFDVLYEAQNLYEAMMKMFIPSECKKNRVRPKLAEKVNRHEFLDGGFFTTTESAKLGYIVDGFKGGSSSALSICADQAMSKKYEDLTFLSKWYYTEDEYIDSVKEDECGGHGIVVNAMRWRDGKCELFIRNSWGKGSALSGWEDANHLLKFTHAVENIRSK